MRNVVHQGDARHESARVPKGSAMVRREGYMFYNRQARSSRFRGHESTGRLYEVDVRHLVARGQIDFRRHSYRLHLRKRSGVSLGLSVDDALPALTILIIQ